MTKSIGRKVAPRKLGNSLSARTLVKYMTRVGKQYVKRGKLTDSVTTGYFPRVGGCTEADAHSAGRVRLLDKRIGDAYALDLQHLIDFTQ